jgi:hypothetical protein
MANFSSFFPTAAGGGGIGQTITVGDYSYPNAISLEAYEDTLTQLMVGSYAYLTRIVTPSTSSPTSYAVTPSSNNTYATLANITSATNGGGIYFLGADYQNSVNYAPVFGWRITIDGGTPYEITSPSAGAKSQVVVMGAGYEIYGGYAASQQRESSASFGQIKNAASGVTGAYNSFNNGHYYTSQNNSYSHSDVTILPAEIQCTLGLPYVYFETSCLVEFKVTEASSFSSGSGKALIKTF